MEVEVEVEEPFDLDLTLSPSFVSSMYVRLRERSWAKVAGRLAGLRVEQVGGGLLRASHSGHAARDIEEVVVHEAGCWHRPFEEGLARLPPSLREPLELLASTYPGVRLPAAPWDLPYVIIAVALSRRTRYDSLVLKWCRRIWAAFGGDLVLLSRAPAPLLKERVGSSYQVIQLKEVVDGLLSIPARLTELSAGLSLELSLSSPLDLTRLSPPIARVLLLRACKFLGPKTVDSIILSCLKDPSAAPCDTHLSTVATRVGLVPRGLSQPSKPLCSRRSCRVQPLPSLPRCPLEDKCLRAEVAKLGSLAGWLQTLCYIHGSSVCRSRRPRCASCPLEAICAASPSAP
ncbi:MAG: hypothetical protein QXT74_01350 [Candidatus Nezhaarchaeales archaeon]